MRERQTIDELDRLIAQLESARRETKDDIAEGLARGGRLRDTTREVGDSSSNSWVGWHARMYYDDFQEPPVGESWNAEWGGVYAYPERWRARTLQEVQEEAERRAGVNLTEIARYADRARERCEELHREVLTVVSPICDVSGLEREADLLKKLEDIDWIISPANFIEAIRPTSIWSRDSGALSQGMQVPLHLNVEAAIVTNTSTLATCRSFLDDSIRLARQARAKISVATPPGVAVRGEASDRERLQRQLRNRSLALFVVLAIALGGIIVFSLRHWSLTRLAQAIAIVSGGALVAALYALLVDRRHASRALAVAAGAIGAIAAVEQILAHWD